MSTESQSSMLRSLLAYPRNFRVQNVPNDVLGAVRYMTPTPFASLLASVPGLGQIFIAHPRTLPLEAFMKQQEKFAWARLLDNIHPKGTKPGCVVASPSKNKPDYWYQWTRDSALVMRTVVDAYRNGDQSKRILIDEYVQTTRELQQLETTIGGFTTGGLGDVKYHVDNTVFTAEWGRPQNDGPALRIITLSEFANHLLDFGTESDKDFVKTVLYDSAIPSSSVLKGDLEHIVKRWSTPGFDLWEEVNGSHFYTALSIKSGLEAGAGLATRLGDTQAAQFYLNEAQKVGESVDRFWDEKKRIIRVSLDHELGRKSEENAHDGDAVYGKTSELDTATLLAVLHAGRDSEWELDPKVFATLDKIIPAFQQIYSINACATNSPALGRYPEDRYDGVGLSEGHPWYLCTLSAAQVLYIAAGRLAATSTPFEITEISRDFYSRFLPNLPKTGTTTIQPNSEEMKQIISGKRKMADGFVSMVQKYVRSDGRMDEQFHRTTGEGRGAKHLTWSYAAFITASQARRVAFDKTQSVANLAQRTEL